MAEPNPNSTERDHVISTARKAVLSGGPHLLGCYVATNGIYDIYLTAIKQDNRKRGLRATFIAMDEFESG